MTDRKDISAGVPQGSVLGPILHLLYMDDIPTNDDTMTVIFADDMEILAISKEQLNATDS